MGILNRIKSIFSNEVAEGKLKKVTAIVLAAGSSTRMGQDKLLMEILDVPVLAHTLMAFENSEHIDEIIVVCRAEDIIPYGKICGEFSFSKITKIIKGGANRAESSLCGIKATSKDTGLVAIHDAARPFITGDIIENLIIKAAKTAAAAPCVPLKDSIKEVSGGVITKNVDRDSIMIVQTPQVFDRDLIKVALEKAIADDIVLTDDCSAVEHVGINVAVVEGSYDNIKVTTPSDIPAGEAILSGRD